jgi:DHA1 family solute carrier family 18 vesicular amine transporter 1/2
MSDSRGVNWTPLVVVAYALCLDYLVYGLIVPLTPFSPAGITADAKLSMLAGGYALGVLVATPLFAQLGDRIGFPATMIVGAVLLAFATLVFAFAPNYELMLVGRLLQGAAAAATWTVGLALLAVRYADNRAQVMGYALMGSTAGSVLGPLFGGWLYGIGGYRLPFFVVLGLIGLEIVLLPTLRRDDVSREPQTNVLAFVLDRSILVPAFAVVLAASAWSILEPLVPNHLRRTTGAGPAAIGAAFAISTVVYGLWSPAVGWIVTRIGTMRTMLIGMVAMAIVLPLIAVLGTLWSCGLALCFVSVAYALLLNPTSAELGDAVERRGGNCYLAVYAVFNIAFSVGTIGSATLAATLLERTNLLVVLLTVSGVLLLAIPALLLIRPRETNVRAGAAYPMLEESR